MISTCPYCQSPLPHHDGQCRVPGDLDRFERIHALLRGRADKSFLRQNLMRHLIDFGRVQITEQPQANSATTGA